VRSLPGSLFWSGANAFEKYGEYIPQAVYDSIERNHLALKGPVTTPIAGGFASINVHLRKKFELFANFRPIKNLPGWIRATRAWI
jgi:isocitrate dehydrogenase (NAD+)